MLISCALVGTGLSFLADAVINVLAVSTLVDTWYGEDHLYFKVLVEGGDEYVVRRDDEGEWAVHSYRAVR